ncbi:MAG: hypothetical protein Q8R04_00175 [Nanoarchaeota archaeon]|nr:hypothetical protein [Nanoarchaeota archaeon]
MPVYDVPKVEYHPVFDKIRNPHAEVRALSAGEVDSFKRKSPLYTLMAQSASPSSNTGRDSARIDLAALVNNIDVEEIKRLHDSGQYLEVVRKYEPVLRRAENYSPPDTLKQKFADALGYLGSSHYRTGNIENGIFYTKWYIKVFPHDTTAYLSLGTMYWELDKKNGRREHLEGERQLYTTVLRIAQPDSEQFKKAQRRLALLEKEKR